MMKRDLIRCSEHPGRHYQTPRCISPQPESLGDSIGAWLEARLNPKRGDEARRRCPACGNVLVSMVLFRPGAPPRELCVYCDVEVPPSG